MGKLHTCYAPVRRSPSNKASFVHAAPRLACVKPIASVHPEPGSNSSLYIYFFYSFVPKLKLYCSWNWTVVFYYLVLILHFCCFQSFKELVSVFVETDCKVTTFFWIDKIFQKKIFIFSFQTSALLTRRQPLSIADAKLLLFPKLPKYFCVFFESFS